MSALKWWETPLHMTLFTHSPTLATVRGARWILRGGAARTEGDKAALKGWGGDHRFPCLLARFHPWLGLLSWGEPSHLHMLVCSQLRWPLWLCPRNSFSLREFGDCWHPSSYIKETLSWSRAFFNVYQEQSVCLRTRMSVLGNCPNAHTPLGTLLGEEGWAQGLLTRGLASQDTLVKGAVWGRN